MTEINNKKIIFAFLFCLLLLPSFQASADVESAQVIFEKGNKSYEEGNFAEAVQHYDEILNLGVRNFKVFYNLGNSYFRQNHLGKAIVNYRRALLLEPRDEDAQANLSFAKLFTLDKIEEQKISPFSNLLQWFLSLLSADEFALLASFSYTLAMAFGILMIFKKSRRYLRFAFLVFMICLAFFGSSLFAKIHFDSLKYGVVVVPEAQVRSGPGDDYILQFTGHEGLEFRVEEKSEEWYRISLPNGIRGWIPVEAVEII
jgi:tetratricopeptide (TPR) repeat protein